MSRAIEVVLDYELLATTSVHKTWGLTELFGKHYAWMEDTDGVVYLQPVKVK